jgi:hypothetical protein
LTRAYVDTARMFCRKSMWLRQDITTVDTVANTISYSLGTDTYAEFFGVKKVVLERATGDLRELTEKDSRFWDLNASASLPEFYEYVPDATIRLYKTPDGAYPLTITAFIQPKRTATSIDSRLLTRWEEEIKKGTLARALMIPGMPFTDPLRAMLYDADFKLACASAQAQADRGYNPGADTVDVTGGPPSGMVRTAILPI